MGSAVDVTSPTFAEEVLEASYERPVLVDFYAQWCGPCQMLKPILEKLVQEYDFVLAKVDIDHNPEVANAYQVEGVPDVRVVVDGEVKPGFVGVLPEPQIRELLSGLGLESRVDQGLAQLEALQDSGEDLGPLVAQLRSQFPQNPAILLKSAQVLIVHARPGNDYQQQAENLLAAIDPYDRDYGDQATALQALMDLKRQAQSNATAGAYGTGCQAAATGDYETALEQFLTAIEQGQQREPARQAMVTLFKLLGDQHPLSLTYRRRLMQALY